MYDLHYTAAGALLFVTTICVIWGHQRVIHAALKQNKLVSVISPFGRPLWYLALADSTFMASPCVSDIEGCYLDLKAAQASDQTSMAVPSLGA